MFRVGLRFMSSVLEFAIVAGLRGAVRAASTRFDVLHT